MPNGLLKMLEVATEKLNSFLPHFELPRGTEGTATFTALFPVSPLPDGGTNFLGPYAHGPRDMRFCYLSWLAEDEDGKKRMFSRVKLPLSPLRWTRVEAAARTGTPIMVRLSLWGKGGRPVCASVSDDAIHWEG